MKRINFGYSRGRRHSCSPCPDVERGDWRRNVFIGADFPFTPSNTPLVLPTIESPNSHREKTSSSSSLLYTLVSPLDSIICFWGIEGIHFAEYVALSNGDCGAWSFDVTLLLDCPEIRIRLSLIHSHNCRALAIESRNEILIMHSTPESSVCLAIVFTTLTVLFVLSVILISLSHCHAMQPHLELKVHYQGHGSGFAKLGSLSSSVAVVDPNVAGFSSLEPLNSQILAIFVTTTAIIVFKQSSQSLSLLSLSSDYNKRPDEENSKSQGKHVLVHPDLPNYSNKVHFL
ncbi:hypothetical protein Syun_009354 [Stephania yunnanensis]|uniref:Uncharacterized protein n=1 Tax=Stephania yunnanensis TaxID=152371 RepID=A0AAP0PQT1_9MAGN